MRGFKRARSHGIAALVSLGAACVHPAPSKEPPICVTVPVEQPEPPPPRRASPALPPDAGRLDVVGFDAQTGTRLLEGRRQIGYLAKDPRLHEQVTAFECGDDVAIRKEWTELERRDERGERGRERRRSAQGGPAAGRARR